MIALNSDKVVSARISRFGKVAALVLLSMILTASACTKSGPPTPPPASPATSPKTTSAAFEFDVPSELPIAMVGQPYSYSFADPGNFRGGKAPYSVPTLYSFKAQDASELSLDATGIKFDGVTGILSGTPKPGSEGAFKGTVEAIDATRKGISKEVTLYILSDIVTVKGVGKITATLQWGHLASVNKEAYQKYGDRLPEMAEKNPYELLGLGDVLPPYGVRAEVSNYGQERPRPARAAKELLVVPHTVGAADSSGLSTLLPKPAAQITAKVSLDGVPKSTALFPNQYLGAAQARATITQDGKSLHFEIAGSGEAGKALYFGGETGDNDGGFEAWVRTPYILKLTNTGTTEQSINVTFQLGVDRTRPERKVNIGGAINVEPSSEYYARLALATRSKGQEAGVSTQLAFGNEAPGGGIVPLQMYTKEVKLQFTVPPGSHVLKMGLVSASGEKGSTPTETATGASTFHVTGSITMLATISATGEPVYPK